LHKIQPLVIDHSKKPQSFSGIKLSQLPVIYRNNERAWMRSDIWVKWLHYIDFEFRIQDRKILLLVDNALSHSSPESNKTLSVNNVEVDDNQLNSENEVLMDDLPNSRDNNETERSLEVQHRGTRGRPRGSTCGRPRGSTRGRPAEAHVENHTEAHAEGLMEAHVKEQEPTPILLADETKTF
ncbi:12760_t:CDS:1, partial [Gigaspora rosea]